VPSHLGIAYWKTTPRIEPEEPFITRERTESEAVLAEAEAAGKCGLHWTAAPTEGPVDGPQMDSINNDLAHGRDD
jgi:hypothetical protein